MLLRLDRIISERTHYSRREIKQMAAEGRISVDGSAVRDTALKFEDTTAVIRVDGVQLGLSRWRYFMLNKPAGVISATEDSRERTVLDLLPQELAKLGLSPAGRLDKDAEGLVILTNDGDFIHSVISPKRHVWKKYRVSTSGEFAASAVREFAQGMVLEDGLNCLPAKLEIIGKHDAHVFVREGKFHQVKRMCAAVGCPVTRLERLAVGGLTLDPTLGPGEYRELEPEQAKTVFKNCETPL